MTRATLPRGNSQVATNHSATGRVSINAVRSRPTTSTCSLVPSAWITARTTASSILPWCGSRVPLRSRPGQERKGRLNARTALERKTYGQIALRYPRSLPPRHTLGTLRHARVLRYEAFPSFAFLPGGVFGGDGTTLLDARKGGRTAPRDGSTSAARESAARPPKLFHMLAATTLRR